MMEWLAENWFWVLIGILFVGIHIFGHGSHGSHGGGKHDENDSTDKRNSDESDRT